MTSKDKVSMTKDLASVEDPLASLNLNSVPKEESKTSIEDSKGEIKEGGCEFCHKENPKKRCSKRHPKCLKFMFCDEVCEKRSHQKKKAASAAAPPPQEPTSEVNDENQPAATDEAAAKAEAAELAAKAKKKAAKKAKKKQGQSNSNEFEWHRW